MSDTYFCEIEETNLRFCEKALSDEELVMRNAGFSDRCVVCGRKIKSEEIGLVHPVTLEDVCKECWNLL